MILRVSFSLTNCTRSVFSQHRPDWTGINKPAENCGTIEFESGECQVGQTVNATIKPLRPELWSQVKVGDVLQAKWGPKTIGEALVLSMESK